uniref:CRISPR pre-crRNA endoribonuclease Cas5d n=1 Tax=Faecalibacterium prausnitzii TaxID=853 RepID=A0A564TFE3_9FIRM|nr:CRISPR pre-crRNA endoribonuclease Cas5d [Faecalibacterium prausnitzii]
MSMLIEVWGDYACFTRPEMKTERVSYDMITPSAARGLVEAIYWHPGLRYTVDRIYLLKPFGLDPEDEASTEEYTQRPIRFTNIRRNEVKSTLLSSAALSAAKGGTPPVLYTSEDIQQRAAMVLQDVHYVIECHFDLTDKASPSDNPRQVSGHPAPTPAQRPVLSPALFRVPGVPG